MQAFQYDKVDDVGRALSAASVPHAKFVAGGTTLIDRMKLNVWKKLCMTIATGIPSTTILLTIWWR
jgi:CO/xanthine dehydrogenase FAD-binding subunit